MPHEDHVPLTDVTRLALHATSAAVLVTDNTPSRHVMYCNPAFAQLAGRTEGDVNGRPLQTLLDASADISNLKHASVTPEEGHAFDTLPLHNAQHGRTVQGTFNVTPVYDSRGTVTHHVWVQTTALDGAATTLDAERDPVTRLPLRAFLIRELETAAIRAQFDANAAVGMVRIDGTRPPLPALPTGTLDVIRRTVGTRLRAALRTLDVVAVLAPDQFGLLLHGVQDDTNLQIVKDRVRAALREPVELHGRAVNLNVSTAFLMPDWETHLPHEILREADEYLPPRPAAPTPTPPPAPVSAHGNTVAVSRNGQTISVTASSVRLDLTDTEAFFLLLFLQHAEPGRALHFRTGGAVRDRHEVVLRNRDGEARVPAQDLLVRLHNHGFPGTARPMLKKTGVPGALPVSVDAGNGALLLRASGVAFPVTPQDARVLHVALLLSASMPVVAEYRTPAGGLRLAFHEANAQLQLPQGPDTWAAPIVLDAGARYLLAERLQQTLGKLAAT